MEPPRFVPEPFIRPTALCVIRRVEQILVQRMAPRPDGVPAFRPLGGGIEFGEYAIDAARREMQEELGANVVNPLFLGTFENIFRSNGEPAHEIAFIYEAQFPDPSWYECETFAGLEDDGAEIHAAWKPLLAFEQGKALLYPEGPLAVLTQP